MILAGDCEPKTHVNSRTNGHKFSLVAAELIEYLECVGVKFFLVSREAKVNAFRLFNMLSVFAK